jgi:hypothetical protein
MAEVVDMEAEVMVEALVGVAGGGKSINTVSFRALRQVARLVRSLSMHLSNIVAPSVGDARYAYFMTSHAPYGSPAEAGQKNTNKTNIWVVDGLMP